MIKVAYPDPSFKIKKEKGRELIFDGFRKKWVALTPEEWVRQNFLQFLTVVLKYPAGLIAVEKELKLGELNKRFDILIYNNDLSPFMMIECKAPEINLKESSLQQVLNYNIGIPVTYVGVTNGHYSYCWEITGQQLKIMDSFPEHK